LGIDADEPLAPEKFRHDLMEALHGWMLSLASEAPVVLAGEDMHWGDPSTLELIALLQDRLAQHYARGAGPSQWLLVVVSYEQTPARIVSAFANRKDPGHGARKHHDRTVEL